MPTGTKVESCYQQVKKEGHSEGSAAAICQASTGESLKTGRKLKRVKVLAPRVKGLQQKNVSGQDRGKIRKIQDRLLSLAVVQNFVRTQGENKPLFEGGPSVSEIRQMIYPQWTYKFEEVIQEHGSKSLQSEQKAISDEDRRLVYKVLTDNGPDVDMWSAKFGRLVGQAVKAGAVARGYDAVYEFLEKQGLFGPKSDKLRASDDRYY